MNQNKPTSHPQAWKITTKDTIATLTSEDMQRVFDYISVDDYGALQKLIISGRAFHLPKGLEVYVLASEGKTDSTVKLRIKGSTAEIWGSARAIS